MINRRALVVGAVGRLGESVLTQVIARGTYRSVIVQGSKALTTAIAGLEVQAANEADPIDDAFLVLSNGPEQEFRSFYGRDGCFDSLTPSELASTARHAAERGARRLLLVAPMPAWQQVAHAPRGLMNASEVHLASMSFESIVILRPVANNSASGQSLVERFTQFYLQIQMFMLPRSLPTMTSDQIASAAVQLLLAARPGVDVIAAADMTERLGRLTKPISVLP